MRVFGVFIVVLCYFQFGSVSGTTEKNTYVLMKSGMIMNKEIIPSLQAANREIVNILSNNLLPNGSIDSLKEMQQLPILGNDVMSAINKIVEAFGNFLLNQDPSGKVLLDENFGAFNQIADLLSTMNDVPPILANFFQNASHETSLPNFTPDQCNSLKQYVKESLHKISGVYGILKYISNKWNHDQDYNILNNPGSDELGPELAINAVYELWTNVASGALHAIVQISQSTSILCDANIDWNWKLSNFNNILKNIETETRALISALEMGEQLFNGLSQSLGTSSMRPTTYQTFEWTDPACC